MIDKLEQIADTAHMMQDNTRYIADNTHDIQEDKRLRRQIAIDNDAHAQKVCVQPSTEISSLLFARTQRRLPIY